jgi:hypothetical protein
MRHSVSEYMRGDHLLTTTCAALFVIVKVSKLSTAPLIQYITAKHRLICIKFFTVIKYLRTYIAYAYWTKFVKLKK